MEWIHNVRRNSNEFTCQTPKQIVIDFDLDLLSTSHQGIEAAVMSEGSNSSARRRNIYSGAFITTSNLTYTDSIHHISVCPQSWSVNLPCIPFYHNPKLLSRAKYLSGGQTPRNPTTRSPPGSLCRDRSS